MFLSEFQKQSVIHLNFTCLRAVKLLSDIVSGIYINIDYLMQSIL